MYKIMNNTVFSIDKTITFQEKKKDLQELGGKYNNYYYVEIKAVEILYGN